MRLFLPVTGMTCSVYLKFDELRSYVFLPQYGRCPSCSILTKVFEDKTKYQSSMLLLVFYYLFVERCSTSTHKDGENSDGLSSPGRETPKPSLLVQVECSGEMLGGGTGIYPTLEHTRNQSLVAACCPFRSLLLLIIHFIWCDHLL